MKPHQDIHERIYQYILSVLKILKKISRSYENDVIIGQLTRSITSVGANDQEADGSFTKADFIHCYTIARKELKESVYWLRLLGDCNQLFNKDIRVFMIEGDEIMKIITVIILNTKKNMN
jgi:four helix bundle protein